MEQETIVLNSASYEIMQKKLKKLDALEKTFSNLQYIDDGPHDEEDNIGRRLWHLYTEMHANTRLPITSKQYFQVMRGFKVKIAGKNMTIPHCDGITLISNLSQISRRMSSYMKKNQNQYPKLARGTKKNKYKAEHYRDFGFGIIKQYLAEKPLHTWIDTWDWNPFGAVIEVGDPEPPVEEKKKKSHQLEPKV